MPKYTVAVQVYATMYVSVEADSEKEAREKAEQSDEPTLCWQCANEVEIGCLGDVTSVELVES